jgi:hypothetical protein
LSGVRRAGRKSKEEAVLLFQLVMKPKLIVAWRAFHDRELEGTKAA